MDIVTFAIIVFSVDILDDFQAWIAEFINDIYTGLKEFFISIFNAVIDKISNFLVDFWKVITDFFKSAMLTIFDVLKDVLYFVFDAILGLLVFILDTVGTAFNLVDISNWINFPPEVANMIGLIGLSQAMGLIMSAIVIRISLQLIPFTRLGS